MRKVFPCTGVCEQDVHGDQEGRLLSISGESETFEPVCDKEAFQDGECGNAPVSAQEMIG